MTRLFPETVFALALGGLTLGVGCGSADAPADPQGSAMVASADASSGGPDDHGGTDGGSSNTDGQTPSSDAGPGSDGTATGDAGPVGADAGDISYAGVQCGDSLCTGGNICCEKPTLTCMSEASCGDDGIKFECDGPEDCAADEDCCGYGGSTCTAKDPDNLICKGGDNYLCHTDDECGVGRVCCPAASTTYHVCRFSPCTGD